MRLARIGLLFSVGLLGASSMRSVTAGLPSAEQIRQAIAAAHIDESDLADQGPIVDVTPMDSHNQPRGGA